MPLAPTRTIRIPSRYAMSFDGVDDRVVVSSTPRLAGLNNLTVMIWLYWFGGSPPQYIIAKTNNNPGGREWAFYFGSPTMISWQVIQDSPFTFSDTSTTFEPGVFTHAAGNYAAGTQTLYKNATLAASKTTNITIQATTTPITIGVRGDNLRWFRGLISQVLVYSPSLSPDKISLNYQNFYNPVRDGLVLCLIADPQYIRDIDGDGILEWLDLSGQNNHGKIYGATLIDLFKSPARTLPAVRTLPPAR